MPERVIPDMAGAFTLLSGLIKVTEPFPETKDSWELEVPPPPQEVSNTAIAIRARALNPDFINSSLVINDVQVQSM